ncbi:MAG TPA: MarC family protein [Polyangiaceae bacterium]|nr:MarC family protein [Polyangiaceae bacterium]
MNSADWSLLGTMLAGFFAIMNPIANIPIFLGLTDGYSAEARRRVALRSTLVAFGTVAVFTALGQLIFSMFGITIAAFRIAGGVIIFLIGYQMLQGHISPAHQTPRIREAGVGEPGARPSRPLAIDEGMLSVAISPLGVPLLAGPGTIVTAIGFSAGHWRHAALSLVAFALLCATTWFGFVAGERSVRYLGNSFLTVITRLMGLILAVVGTEMFLTGLREAFPALR